MTTICTECYSATPDGLRARACVQDSFKRQVGLQLGVHYRLYVTLGSSIYV